MIDPKQIPDEVVEAALSAFALASGLGIFPDEEKDEEWRNDLVNGMSAAIAAAINAWPGAALSQRIRPTIGFRRITLPLPQEKQND